MENSTRELMVGDLLPNMPDPNQRAFEFSNHIQTTYSQNCFILPQHSLYNPVAFESSLSPDVEPNALILANNQVHASYLISGSSRVFGPSFSMVGTSGLISLLGDKTSLRSCFEPSNAFIYRINRHRYGVVNGQTPFLDNGGPHHALVIERVCVGILPSSFRAPEFIPMRPQQIPKDAEVATQVHRFRGSAGFMSNNPWLWNSQEDLLRRGGSAPQPNFPKCNSSFPSSYALGGHMSGHARKKKLEALLNATESCEPGAGGSSLEATTGQGFENASVVKVEPA
ncbi:uncharacterized protein LOC115753237 [Rhodamnia argentea]|uniref:Uncharacterized protein LOC115753237 n=1 Tax=Rhodamnia argentea TaxID=178133 RepID=A0A8B8QN03_9MYRT|nr:uncharacterized protein LOC115753237 [Rhodamnia argentea]XP_030547628.1 uncharacterized protein LOC115753237 [Rhodamnia argentea]